MTLAQYLSQTAARGRELRLIREAWEACEAEMRSPGLCGKCGHLVANLDMSNEQGVCAWCEEIAKVEGERDKLSQQIEEMRGLIQSSLDKGSFDYEAFMVVISAPASGQCIPDLWPSDLIDCPTCGLNLLSSKHTWDNGAKNDTPGIVCPDGRFTQFPASEQKRKMP